MNSKNFWISKNLTERAAIVLSDMGIDTLEELVGSILNEDQLLKKKNCAGWSLRKWLKNKMSYSSNGITFRRISMVVPTAGK